MPSSDKNKSNYENEEELSSDYLDIWDINPSYKDLNLQRLSVKKHQKSTALKEFR